MASKESALRKLFSGDRAQTRLLVICLLIILSFFAFKTVKDNRGSALEISTSEANPAKEETTVNQTEPDAGEIPVYLVGAIKKPGIYRVRPGTYLYQLIDLAGGLTDDAADDAVNLAASIETNQLIRIPTCEEAACGLIDELAPEDSPAKLVDLNKATQRDLETLPGVGPVTAQAILNYRQEHGSFKTIDDLMKVAGIKQARFTALKDLICVTSG